MPGARSATRLTTLVPCWRYYYLAARRFADSIRVGEEFASTDTRSTQSALAAAYALFRLPRRRRSPSREDNLKKAAKFTDDQGKPIDEAAYRKLLEDVRKNMLAQVCGPL